MKNNVDRSIHNYGVCIKINVGTVNLLDFARKLKKIEINLYIFLLMKILNNEGV